MKLRSGEMMALALTVSLASTSVAVADEMFLKFTSANGIEILGDSTDKAHAGELALASYSVGVTAESSWTKGGGASVGKPNPADLSFTMNVNRAVPPILQHITTGRAASKAVLTLRSDSQGNKTGDEYAKYTFEGLFFTSVGQGLNGAGHAVSAVSAIYKTLRLQTFAPGSSTPLSCIFWDIPGGVATDCLNDNR
jgi:type VI secretion system secreted protein Hcp